METLEEDLLQQARDLGYRGQSKRVPHLRKWIQQYYENKTPKTQDKKKRNTLFHEAKKKGWTKKWKESSQKR